MPFRIRLEGSPGHPYRWGIVLDEEPVLWSPRFPDRRLALSNMHLVLSQMGVQPPEERKTR